MTKIPFLVGSDIIYCDDTLRVRRMVYSDGTIKHVYDSIIDRRSICGSFNYKVDLETRLV